MGEHAQGVHYVGCGQDNLILDKWMRNLGNLGIPFFRDALTGFVVTANGLTDFVGYRLAPEVLGRYAERWFFSFAFVVVGLAHKIVEILR